jgi:LuxR family transcriptional regulator of csgAB operon
MRLAMSEKQKNLRQPKGRTLYIVGPRRLQNDLIASCIESETGCECLVMGDINHIPTDDPKRRGPPSLVLWDCQGKDLKNFMVEFSSYIKQKQPANRLALFNVCRDIAFERKFILEGIQGLFFEHDPLDIFLKGVRAVIDEKLWFPREIMANCILEDKDQDKASKSSSTDLTPRQTEILAQIAVGSTNDEIAEKLCISPHTVKTHLYNIFQKINVPNRIQAALWAAKNL